MTPWPESRSGSGREKAGEEARLFSASDISANLRGMSRSHRHLPLAALLLAAFVSVSIVAAAGWVHELDLWVLRVTQEYSTPTLDELGLLLSIAGSVPVSGLAILSIALALRLRGRRRTAARLLAVFAVTALIELVLKMSLPQTPIEASAVRVASPSFLLAFETPFPYPSGHMIRSVLALGALFIMVRRRVWKLLLVSLLLLMALSRIYVGAHWISDVAGGTLLGAAGLVWAFSGGETESRAKGRRWR